MKKRSKTRTVYVVIQEGGSSTEAYASDYDEERQARRAMDLHDSEGSYRSCGPFPMTLHTFAGKMFVAEGDVLELLSTVKVAEYDYGAPPVSRGADG